MEKNSIEENKMFLENKETSRNTVIYNNIYLISKNVNTLLKDNLVLTLFKREQILQERLFEYFQVSKSASLKMNDEVKLKNKAHRQSKKQMLEYLTEQCKIKGIIKSSQEIRKMIDQIDKSNWEKCNGDIDEYKTSMRKEIERVTSTPEVERTSNVNEMINAMVTSLDQLKYFKETTSGIGPNDLNLLSNLIDFIEKMKASKPTEIKENMHKTIALYFDRLFTPIYKTIINTIQHKEPPRYKPPTPQQPIQQLPPVAPPQQVAQPPPVVPQQPPQRIQPITQPLQAPAPEPQQPAAQPRSDDESKAMVAKLFAQVRTECAVFYATPHPPHF